MPDFRTSAPHNPEFARVIEVSKLNGLDEFSFDLSPDAAEAIALARLMGAQAIRKLRFAGRLSPAPQDAWLLEAALGATVIQTCVVSLEPVSTRIDVAVRRVFSHSAGHGSPEIVILDEDEDDEMETLGAEIDLGLVAIEALALSLPAYPRRSGARLQSVVTSDEARPEVKPFASLAALRAKMSDAS